MGALFYSPAARSAVGDPFNDILVCITGGQSPLKFRRQAEIVFPARERQESGCLRVDPGGAPDRWSWWGGQTTLDIQGRVPALTPQGWGRRAPRMKPQCDQDRGIQGRERFPRPHRPAGRPRSTGRSGWKGRKEIPPPRQTLDRDEARLTTSGLRAG